MTQERMLEVPVENARGLALAKEATRLVGHCACPGHGRRPPVLQPEASGENKS